MASGRNRGMAVLMLSLVAAVVAAGLIYTLLQGIQDDPLIAQKPQDTSEIVVAAFDLPPGITIAANHLKMRRLPDVYVTDEVFRTPEEVIGRVPRERILEGEFIREERLADAQAGVGLTAVIPRGMRAFAVDVKGGAAVSGFLNPGNYVDVLVTFADADKPETVTLLQAVNVLAVNEKLSDPVGEVETSKKKKKSKIKPSITLAVTPEQAIELAHANEMGEVTLSLRNDIDVTETFSHGRHAETYIGESDETRIEVKDWQQKTTVTGDGRLRIIRGNVKSEYEVESDGTARPITSKNK